MVTVTGLPMSLLNLLLSPDPHSPGAVPVGSFHHPSSAPPPPIDLEENWQGPGVGSGRDSGKLDSRLIPPREVESEESCLKG